MRGLGRKLLIIALIVPVMAGALPSRPLSAQGGLSDEQMVLLDRAFAAAEALGQAGSYQYTGEQHWSQSWTGGAGDQVTDQASESTLSTVTESYVQTESGPNIALRYTVTYPDPEADTASALSFVLNAEVRVVDGTVYVYAAYDHDNPDLPAVPGRWIKVTRGTLVAWPGLAGFGLEAFFDDLPDTVVVRHFGMSLEDAKTILTEHATNVSSEAITLEDGTPAEMITVTLDSEGWRLLAGTGDDPIGQAVASAVSGDPFTLSFVLDEAGNLIGVGTETAFSVSAVNIGGMGSAPEGYTIDVESRDSLHVRFAPPGTPIEAVAVPDLTAPVEPVEVPDVVDQPWWNDRVFYEIFVRSFYDSDGDGIGDLQGVIQKLDYLNDGDPATTDDLGVTGIWLMPIMQSPSYHGYDVTDYYTVEEDYGTNEDFKQLVEEAHKRGIVVIIDLVLNHTSNQHPWFLASRDGDPEYADWYIWSDTDPGQLGPWGQDVWHPAGGRFYFGLFWEGMPDLNYRNPAVNEQMNDVIRFWLEEMGADGYRLDAIKHLIEEGNVMANAPATLEWLEGFHDLVKSIKPDAFTVGEVMGDASQILVQYTGARVDTAFEFNFASAALDSAQTGNAGTIIRNMNTILDLYPPGQYSTFLTNHDQNRVMSQLNGDVNKAKLAASILLTSPGVPFLYYGEEVGMTGQKPDERIRTPMQWDVWYRMGGFTEGVPWEEFQDNYQVFNVALMNEDDNSLLNHYRALIHLRNEHPALRTGAMMIAESGHRSVYSFLRFTGDEAILVVINLSDETVSDYALSLGASPLSGSLTAEVLYGTGTAAAPTLDDRGGFADYVPLDSLPPQSTFILQLK